MKLAIKIYNKTLEVIPTYEKIKKTVIRDEVKKLFKTEIEEISLPNTTMEYTVFEAILAYKSTKDKTKLKQKDEVLSISVDGRCIKNGYIYAQNTKRELKKQFDKKIVNKIFQELCYDKIKNVVTKQICKIIFKRNSARFYLIIPTPINEKSKPERELISLDPGVRSFLTFYDLNSYGSIGEKTSIRLKRLHKHIDRLQSKIDDKKTKFFKRQNIIKAKRRLHERIKNIVKDLHYKTCNFLTKYKYVLLPKFDTRSMVPKLNKYTRRSLLELSHFQFMLRLIFKAQETGTKVLICNESYTSKTCTNCGKINEKLGKSKVFDCDSCKLNIDRDYNSARNIMLRVLRGGSITSNSNSVD